MPSSSKEIQESTNFPPPESPPLTTPMQQVAPKPSPLSPQLRLHAAPKTPRNRTAISRILFSPPAQPPTIAPATTRTYVAVPSEWFIDTRVTDCFSYLSQDPLLQKMFRRKMLYRTAESNEAVNVNQEEHVKLEVEVLGPPVDYLLTFPLQPPNGLEFRQNPMLENVALRPDQEVSHAWAIGPMRRSRDTFDPLIGPPDFPWNTNGSTKVHTLQNLMSRNVTKITGFAECLKCGKIMGLGYLLPIRFFTVFNYLIDIYNELEGNGESFLFNSLFFCKCDGNMNPGLPIINEDLREINWLFLFLGCSLGHCTLGQLRHFCNQRVLGTEGTKNDLLFRVVLDLCKQLVPHIEETPVLSLHDLPETNSEMEYLLRGSLPATPVISVTTQQLPSRPPRLSSCKWFCLRPKPPRIPRPFPRIVSPQPPPTRTADRSYLAVPAQWCIDSRVGSCYTYVSRDPLLKKMFQRRMLYRWFQPNVPANVNQVGLLELGVKILGSPADYWLTFPLQRPNRPKWDRPDQEVAHAWATGPVKSSRGTLSRQVGEGPEPVSGVKFPWATNMDGATKILSLQSLLSFGIEEILGFVECQKCGEIWGVGYLVPKRILEHIISMRGMLEEIENNGEQVLGLSHFNCKCDGHLNPVTPIIGEDYSKINWLFLFLGRSLGYCTSDQLRYYCSRRKLETWEHKNHLLLAVCADLCEQIRGPKFSDS